MDVGVTLTAPAAELSLQVEAAGQTIDVPVKQLPAVRRDRRRGRRARLARADRREGHGHPSAGTAKSATVRVMPQRKWRIYVAPSSHTDIGYTDLQPKCAERHSQNADTAVDLCRRFPDFTLEPGSRLAGRELPQLRARASSWTTSSSFAKEGRIGVQALYCNILTGPLLARGGLPAHLVRPQAQAANTASRIAAR